MDGRGGLRSENELLFLYNLILHIILLFYFPVLFLNILKGKHKQWPERFGILDQALVGRLRAGRVIWIQAASVGETAIARQLVEAIKREYPGHRILVSTMTATGKKVAEETIGEIEGVIFLPLDLVFVMRKVVRLVKPELLILIETELWPNLINAVHRHGGRIIVASGRIGDRSFKDYQYLRPLLKRVLAKVDVFSMQSRLDAERILALGAPPDKVMISGNIKYDRDFGSNIDKDILYRKLNIDQNTPVLVAGSTHADEEGQLLEVYLKLKPFFSNLVMIIAPRYIDRAGEIKEIFFKQGMNTVSWSEQINQPAGNRDRVVIIDTFGDLAGLYQIATLVFVGGTLIPKGGHNILEPAAYGKAVFVGPHTFNFKEDIRYFLEAEALVQVNDAAELGDTMLKYLNDWERLTEKGEKARGVIASNQGALRANLHQIDYLLTRKPKILLVRLSAIGDVIHALPAAGAIKKAFPNAEINWLVEDRVADLVRLNPHVDKIIIMPRKQWREIAKSNKWQSLKAVVAFLDGLKAYHFDLVLDLHGFFKSALPVGMTKAPVRYGDAAAGEGSGLFYNRTIKVPAEISHKIDRYLYLAEKALGFHAGRVEFGIKTGSRAKEKVTGLLVEHGLTRKKFIVMNPYTTWESKDWVIERYGKLAERIKRELDYEVIFTGGPDDRARINQVLETMSVPVYNLAGLTNLEELAELYQQAELFVGGDTGPMHLAVAVDLPVIAIMGPTNPRIYGPYGERHRVIRDRHLACLNCWKRKCPNHHECMVNITMEEVFTAVKSGLSTVETIAGLEQSS